MSFVAQEPRADTDPGSLAVLPTRTEFQKLTERRSEQNALVNRLTWLLAFRVVLYTLMMIVVLVVALKTQGLVSERWGRSLYFICFLAYVGILVGSAWLRWRGQSHLGSHIHSQLVFDIMLSTALIIATGGVDSGFLFLYSLLVLSATLLLTRRGTILYALLVTLTYLLVAVWQYSGMLVPFGEDRALSEKELMWGFTTHTGGVWVITFLAIFLGDQLRSSREAIREIRVQFKLLERMAGIMLQSLPAGVLTINTDGIIVFSNTIANVLLTGSRHTLAGEPILRVMPKLADCLKGQSPRQQFELRLGNDNDPIFIGGNIAPLEGIRGMTGKVITFENLTELRSLQEEMKHHDRLATLGRFSAGLAHEIRNPLAAMSGCLELLAQDPTLQERGENARMIQIIQRESNRLSSLVKDFLNYARPKPPHLDLVRLGELVERTVETIRTGLEPSAKIQITVTEDIPAFVDPHHMEQVIWNLIRNALEALDSVPDQEAPGVWIWVGRDRGKALLRIEDNGPGIPNENRGKIFEPFYTTKSSGTGLGMAWVYQIIRAQNGTIQVRQSKYGGAAVWLRVPLADGMITESQIEATEAAQQAMASIKEV
ncbi:MAG: hypothetical protein CMH56_13605 [Myxococcales bacterium]|nr:hypothetical protein [Myxococcales bacterium]